MALQPNGPAPYTTAVSAITALDAWRDRGLGVPITPEVLTRAGVPETISPRTLSSMKLLDLVTDEGQPTEQWTDMRSARGDEEYRARLQEWLRSTYAEILQYADPSTATLDRLTEAFRTYEPSGQRKSMAALLLGLWKYAGLPVVESDSAPRASTPRQPRYRPTRKQAVRTRDTPNTPQRLATDLPPGLIGLLQQIPTGGSGWSKDTRDNFVKAFSAVLDFTVPITADDLGLSPDNGLEDEEREP